MLIKTKLPIILFGSMLLTLLFFSFLLKEELLGRGEIIVVLTVVQVTEINIDSWENVNFLSFLSFSLFTTRESSRMGIRLSLDNFGFVRYLKS